MITCKVKKGRVVEMACSCHQLESGARQHVLMQPHSWVKAELLERAQGYMLYDLGILTVPGAVLTARGNSMTPWNNKIRVRVLLPADRGVSWNR